MYVEHHATYSRSRQTADSQVRVLTAHFAGAPLENITPSVVTAFVAARRSAGAAEATVNRNLADLSKMFHLAIDDGAFAGRKGH